jgi:hypothetical protein
MKVQFFDIRLSLRLVFYTFFKPASGKKKISNQPKQYADQDYQYGVHFDFKLGQ